MADQSKNFDVIVVGAGFSGLYMLHVLRQAGFSVRVIDMASDVGGTWYWNRYPGARCDVESLSYSYSFDEDLQQEWEWKERYAPQPEILDYARHVAERFDLRRDIQFDTRVTAAHFNEDTSRWTITTDDGDRYSAHYCVMATGCLSAPRRPDIPGAELFGGEQYHTGLWPHDEVDLTGKRVGVIGTGSSAIQSIPQIAKAACHLTVFQRSAHYSVPAWNGPLEPEVQNAYKARYPEYRERMRTSDAGILYDTHDINLKPAREVPEADREREFEKRWKKGAFNFQNTFSDVTKNQESNDLYVDFVHRKVREVVNDAKLAELLCATDFPLGTKRLCVDIDYFETYNRDDVTLIDLKATPITEITEDGVRTSAGHHELDVIVFATGFDAMTGALNNIDIRGCGGQALREKWADGPRTYLGLAVAGHPNLFTITGPGSPSVFTNMIVAIEQHVGWIRDCLIWMRDQGLDRIEASTAAEDEWVDHVRQLGEQTLYPKAKSWYMGANVPGKPVVFLPYIGSQHTYAQTCEKIAAQGYEGFDTARRTSDVASATEVDLGGQPEAVAQP